MQSSDVVLLKVHRTTSEHGHRLVEFCGKDSMRATVAALRGGQRKCVQVCSRFVTTPSRRWSRYEPACPGRCAYNSAPVTERRYFTKTLAVCVISMIDKWKLRTKLEAKAREVKTWNEATTLRCAHCEKISGRTLASAIRSWRAWNESEPRMFPWSNSMLH